MNDSRMHPFRLVLSVVTIFFLTFSAEGTDTAKRISEGVAFYSHQVNKEDRTSACLEKNQPIQFRSYIRLEFDYKIYRNPNGVFGDICSMEVGKDFKLNMSCNVEYAGRYLIVFLKEDEIIGQYPIQAVDLFEGEWSHVSFVIDAGRGQELFISNERGDGISVPLPEGCERTFRLNFGRCSSSCSKDVASFAIGNLELSRRRNKTEYFWDFASHRKSYAKDTVSGLRLEFENPDWMSDRHSHWVKENTFTIPFSYLLKGTDAEMMMVAENSIYRYDFRNRNLSVQESGKLNFRSMSHSFLWNSERRRVEYFNPTEHTDMISYADSSTRTWVPEIAVDDRWQMQSSICHHKSVYYHMFGYGHHRYSDKIYVNANGLATREIKETGIAPRYMSAAGIFQDGMYICSGVGNRKGEQILGIEIYADLYRLNLGTEEITCLPEVKIPENEIASQNLVFLDDSSFYSLFFNPFQDCSYLLLKRIFLDGREPAVYCDTIPYKFQDISSEARLYIFPDKLYAVTKHKTAGNDCEYNVYSALLPVSRKSQFLIEEESWPPAWLILLFVILIGAGILYMVRIRGARRRTEHEFDEEPGAVRNDGITVDEPSVDASKMEAPDANYGPGIYLLGGFRVINAEGNEITGEFSPMMKRLLSLIILYTVKDDRGVSNVILNDTFWMDKSEESAINNRSVNIRKIRLRFKEVGDFKLVSKNSYWRLVVPDDCMCDVCRAVPFLKRIDRNNALDKEDIGSLLQLAAAGELLPNQNFDFFDELKSYYSNMLIDALNKALEQTDGHALRLSLANAILKFSPLDEIALQVKCQALVGLGKNGLARSAFDIFSKRYESMMGEGFPFDFSQILKEKLDL